MTTINEYIMDLDENRKKCLYTKAYKHARYWGDLINVLAEYQELKAEAERLREQAARLSEQLEQYRALREDYIDGEEDHE